MDTLVIQHYGVKGMKWGVRKARLKKGAKAQAKVAGKFTAKFFLGDIKPTSLVYAEGRKSFKKDVNAGKKALGKVTNSKLFKSVIYDKDNSALTKKGRDNLVKRAKKNRDERYNKALAKEKNKIAKQKERAKATRKLIDDLIAEDKATNKFFGKKYTKEDEARDRAFWEKQFESDLRVDS